MSSIAPSSMHPSSTLAVKSGCKVARRKKNPGSLNLLRWHSRGNSVLSVSFAAPLRTRLCFVAGRLKVETYEDFAKLLPSLGQEATSRASVEEGESGRGAPADLPG